MSGQFEAVFNTRMILNAAKRAGVEPAAVAADAGLDLAVLANPIRRIPLVLHNAVYRHAARRTKDRALALHAGAVSFRSSLDLVGFAVESSPTLLDANALAHRFLRLFSTYLTPALELTGSLAHTILMPAAPGVKNFARNCEYHQALFAGALREMAGCAFELHEVRFQHQRCGPQEAYEQVFQAPVRFGQRRNELIYPADLLHQRCVHADAELAEALARRIEASVRPLPGGQRLVHLVRREIGEDLRRGTVCLQGVAGRLGLRPRTLQHKLRENGTSFRLLLDEARRDLAFTWLRDPALPVGELSYLLGFADTRSFHRAFRRWSATTPGRYRSRLLAGQRG